VDRIKAEIYKTGGAALEIRIHNLIKSIWKKEIIIKYLTFIMRRPIYKDRANIEGHH
jgi:hypothetical protein